MGILQGSDVRNMMQNKIRRCSCLQVESYFFDIRRQLFEYDQVMNTQRDKVRPHTDYNASADAKCEN